MSKRMLQRGRYPKVSPTHNTGSEISPQQLPQNSMNYPETSEVKFYSVQPEQQVTKQDTLDEESENEGKQSGQNIGSPWTEPIYHHGIPASQQSGEYWQRDSSVPPMQVPEADPWAWSVNNSTENLNNHQQQQNWQQFDPWQPSVHHHHQPQYSNAPSKPDTTYQNQPNSNISNMEYTSHQHHPSTIIADQQQNEITDPQIHNQQQQPWDNIAHGTAETEQLNWTYGVQQHYDQSEWPSGNIAQHQDSSQVIASNWNSQMWEGWPSHKDEQLNKSEPNLLLNAPNQNLTHVEQNINYPLEKQVHDICSESDIVDKCSNDLHNKSNFSEYVETCSSGTGVNQEEDLQNKVQKDLDDTQHGSGRLSAFFNNDVQDQIPCVETANIIHDKSLAMEEIEENYSKNDEPVTDEKKINSETGAEDNVKIGDTNYQPVKDLFQESADFVQDENVLLQESLESLSLNSPTGFVEEPLNQEVPEPSPSASNSSNTSSLSGVTQQQPTRKKLVEIESTDEPPNQQVPEESKENINSAAQERERVVIRAREESPFKPPSKQSNIKGIVVQQEISLHSPLQSSVPENVSSVQEVNMETVPDNLERPPDAEEQQKQSSWHASLHRHYVRNQCDSSPSTTLWDSPDIPCVTLAPAAPPFPLLSHYPDKDQNALQEQSHASSVQVTEQMAYSTVVENTIISEDLTRHPVDNKSIMPEEITFSSTELSGSHSLLSDGSVSQISQEDIQKYQHQPADAKLPNINKINNSRELLVQKEKNAIENQPMDLHGSKPNVKEFHSTFQKNPASNSEPLSLERIQPSFEADKNKKLNRIPPGPEVLHSSVNDTSRSWEQFSENRKLKSSDQRCASFDERNYYTDKDRSRPSSRMSLHEPADDRMYREREYRKPYPSEYDRTPSRLSEAEHLHSAKQSQYPSYEQYYDGRYAGYQREEDYYNRARSYRGYDYDVYRQERHPYYPYYDPYRYSYSSYNYGFYDELYRNDPRYRQQLEERYRQYYAQLGYETDYERSSVHSGRSSATELVKETQVSSGYVYHDGDSNESEGSGYNQQYYPYGGELSSKPSSLEMSSEQISTVAARLTPAKFSCSHPIGCFTPSGFLITVIPRQAGSTQPVPVEFHNMQIIMESEASFEELKEFQGPLVRGATHKNDIIEFCIQKIMHFKEKKDIPDRESYILLWELMVLLLRQNGSVAGSDIAELLLKDHEVLRPAQLLSRHIADTPQGEVSLPEISESASNVPSGDTSSPDEGIVVSQDKTILNTTQSLSVDKVTRKFREFLLFGHKKDALEWAMKHGLWGHALFLASKMDLRTYANVMTRFANSLALNDPLQTLYQLMSGRQPAAVTCVTDEKWGDWRPHLAMVLSNPSSHCEVDSRSITTLGDTLADRGCLPAAHFCYLMAQVEFGAYSRKSSKMVLLSSNHLLPFEEFATNEAIQCTEIYEYAQSLANPEFMLPHLQAYKFIYATRLAEHGFLQESLHYCEVISNAFQSSPNSFPNGLVAEVYKLASKLKYHDPHFTQGQGELEEQEDPEWLQKLALLLQNYTESSSHPAAEYQDLVPESNLTAGTDNYNVEPTETHHSMSYNDVQNQSYYSQPNQQNSYQNYNWGGQDSVQHNDIDNQGMAVVEQNINQYQTNTGGNQWDMSTDAHHGVYGEAEKIDEIPPPMSSDVNNSIEYYGASIKQEWNSALSLPSVSLSAVHHNLSKSEDCELLEVRDDTESDTGVCSSSQSTPLHNYLLSKGNSDDKQMLMSHHNRIDSRVLNSCLKSSKLGHLSKSKKSIKFDSSATNCENESGEKSKLHQAVMRRRKMMTRKPLKVITTDSSTEGSPSKEKPKTHQKLSLLATLGIVKSNEQGKTKHTKRKHKSKKKNDTTQKILHSKRTFAIDEPFDTDDSQWIQNKKSVDESVEETKKMISLLERLSSEEKTNSELCTLMANEFKKRPPLIFGGTFPIDEPCEILDEKTLPSQHINQSGVPLSLETFATQSLKMPISAIKKTIQTTYPVDQPYSSKLNYGKKSNERIQQVQRESCSSTQSEGEQSEKHSKMSPFRIFKKFHSPDGAMSPVKKMELRNNDKNSPSPKASPSKSIVKSAKMLIKEYSSHSNKQTSRERTSSVSSIGTQRDRHDSTVSSGSGYSIRTPNVSKRSGSEDMPKVERTEEKPKSQVGKTWLGGIFSRLLPRAPNQMILPDDKNPTIVWDSTKNCWVNTDSTEEDDGNKPIAPPTDMELMNRRNSQELSPPLIPSAPSQVPNKFQRPKTRGMRQNYVDILNPGNVTNKSAAVTEALFPPPVQTSASKMFIPSSAPVVEEKPVDFVSTGQPSFNVPPVPPLEKEEGTDAPTSPPMFDPAEFATRRASIGSHRSNLGRAARRTYPT